MRPDLSIDLAETGNYRIDHCDTPACIRLHCEPSPINAAPQIVARRCQAEEATHFASAEAARAAARRYLPGIAVRVVPVTA